MTAEQLALIQKIMEQNEQIIDQNWHILDSILPQNVEVELIEGEQPLVH